jgi:hypothetical protein
MSNIHDFNKATAVILSKVYEDFPRRLALDVKDLVEGPKEQALYGDTIIWLVHDGFLSCEGRVENRLFYGVTVTGKGLLALNFKPDVLQDTTLGQKIGNAAKEGSKEVLAGLINTLIQIAVTGYLKSPG